MQTLTTETLLAQMEQLKGLTVPYPAGGKCCTLVSVKDDGCIRYKRHKLSQGSSWDGDATETISREMIRKAAAALSDGKPVQVDRLFQGGSNNRSALEAFIAACPSFFLSYPQRVSASGEKLHGKPIKHVVWDPKRKAHAPGCFAKLPKEEFGFVAETSGTAVYSKDVSDVVGWSIDIAEAKLLRSLKSCRKLREHSQKQVQLCIVGHWLGMRSWIAANDHDVLLKAKDYLPDSVVTSLEQALPFASWPKAVNDARLVDCLWFKEGGMPAAFEVEHTTGIMDGLARMQTLKDRMHVGTQFVVVAPDADWRLFVAKAGRDMFVDLNPAFLSYKALDDVTNLAMQYSCTCISLPERMRILEMFLKRPAQPLNK